MRNFVCVTKGEYSSNGVADKLEIYQGNQNININKEVKSTKLELMGKDVGCLLERG